MINKKAKNSLRHKSQAVLFKSYPLLYFFTGYMDSSSTQDQTMLHHSW